MSSDAQTGQDPPITGTPVDVPDPRTVIFNKNAPPFAGYAALRVVSGLSSSYSESKNEG
jgi:hypothetical protein